MPVFRSISLVAILKCAMAAGMEDEVATATWADVKALEPTAVSSVQLLVQNQASSPVTLANCLSSHEIPAGGSLNLTLNGIVGYWVVPESLAWDCDSGPFDLFYVAANLSGPESTAGVGFGMTLGGDGLTPSSESEKADNAAEENTEDMDKDADARGTAVSVAGVELTLATDGDEVRGIRCRADLCSSSTAVPSMPASLELNIMGPKSSVLSFWYGGYGGYHHVHHVHHVHHGYGYGGYHSHHVVVHHHHHWFVSSHLTGEA